MSGTTRNSTIVALLNWQARVVWISDEQYPRQAGFLPEEYVQENYRQQVKEAVSRVVTCRERQEIQIVTEFNEHYRVWLWPLDSPEVAVCALSVLVPAELELLSTRELDCLKLLAHGLSAAEVADKLTIAVSTVHTHLKRAREKLNLPNLEALICFAARHCDPPECPLSDIPVELTR